MKKRDFGWLVSLPFYLVHVGAVAGIAVLGWSWKGAALALALYYVRMFGVTGGYHRYFSHRTFRTGRAFQLFLAVLAQTSVQKGALWWAAHHRDHHKYADTPKDPHSFLNRGLWWSHAGWILSRDTEDTNYARIPDLARYPELRWLNTWFLVPVFAFAAVIFLVGGWFAFVWGFCVSTVMLWHGTFTINSLSHWLGSRRYATADTSKNNLALAIITMGEGWHNNHHYYQRSCRQGFFWWEIDATYYILRALSWVGLVWDIHVPSAKILAGNRESKGQAADSMAAPAPDGEVEDLAASAAE